VPGLTDATPLRPPSWTSVPGVPAEDTRVTWAVVTNRDAATDARADHWAKVYEGRDIKAVSWYQAEPALSIELFDTLGVAPGQGVLDVGGGASLLVDRLLGRGFTDVTVLDISSAALSAAQRRVGTDHRVTWIVQDLQSWQPRRRYDVWHDRAVLHFLSAPAELDAYRTLVERALAPAGAVVIGTFAPDGPESCSGLPVQRYDADGIADVLGPRYAVVRRTRELHTTPGGTVQPFTWVALRRRDPPAAAETERLI